MSAVEPLDWRNLPLADGRVLIEASAGTGKTWTIGAIFLRLLLERGLPVEKILVVTFTDAAAQELRERLRARLADVERWLQLLTESKPASDGDPVAQWLAAAFADAQQAKTALRRIRIARMDFDRAPIATIHALCQRIQTDFPLEAGADFAAAKRLDEDALVRECLDDFWRRRYLVTTEIDADEADAVLEGGPEKLLRDLGDLLRHDARVLAADGLESIPQLIQKLSTPEAITGLRNLAGERKLYAPRKTALSKRFSEVAGLLEAGKDIRDLLTGDKGDVLDAASIAEQLAPGIGLDQDALVQALQRLRGLVKLRKMFVRGKVLADAYAYCKEQLPQRAAQRQGQTFTMLIAAVHERVCADDSALADRLHAAFPAALIDEFQDTDARQFAIFDRIYQDGNGAPRGLLALIGDPKQAIYGFRGGDIAAYLRAREGIPHRYDLTENFRSSTPLIEACNALYAAAGDAFDDDEVRYVPVRPSGRADEKPFACDGATIARPFVIHRFADAEQPRGNKDALERLALADCAARIVEMLNDASLSIDGKRVAPGDIAVLLPQNVQIGTLRELLQAHDVPCTGSGNDSVSTGGTARELELILHAVLNPDDDRAVRGALCTTLLGKRLEDVHGWQHDVAGFERELDRFSQWHELAHARGVLGVVAAILDARAAELLRLPDGERTVADLRHLGELLAERESEACGLEGVCAWLASMRRGEAELEVSNDRRLRSETDASSVQLLTLHAAKGLEFPIVFLPLAWRIASRVGQFAPKVLRFHAARDACVDLGSSRFGENLTRHFAEDLRERLRLLYVAITRAKYAVHAYWTHRAIAPAAPLWQTAAIDRLIHGAQRRLQLDPGEASLPALAEKLGGIAIVEACAAPGAKYVEPAQDAPRSARAPLPELRAFLWSHSFSSITRQRVVNNLESTVADEADSPLPPETGVDAAAAEESVHRELLALDAWRGNAFGIVVHGILEDAWTRQFTERQLGDRLDALGVRVQGGDRDAALAALARMLARVRATDLGDGLRLSDLSDAARVAEFGFQLPVAASLPALRAVCAAYGAADVWPEHISTPTLNGMLNGFSDLIFAHEGRYHVLDYKTNRLGERLNDYREPSLQAAMDAHHYPLQALLYTVALHRYLRRRLDGYAPERHLGESWYLFLRGVGLEPGAGVWRRRWPGALIEALDDAFAGAEIAA